MGCRVAEWLEAQACNPEVVGSSLVSDHSMVLFSDNNSCSNLRPRFVKLVSLPASWNFKSWLSLVCIFLSVVYIVPN